MKRIYKASIAFAVAAATAGAVQLMIGQDAGAAGTYKASATLNGRSGPSLSAGVVKTDMYKAGQRITILCQTSGGAAYGSNIWDKTREGVYVADAYVKTGQDGFVPGMKRCDNDKPTGGPGPGSSLTCATVGHGDQYAAPGSSSGTSSQKIERVIATALGQTGRGLHYSWGGGGRSGPTCGEGISPGGYNDTKVVGFDCSGLTQYAFWKGAGVNIGTYTGAQVGKGKRVTISSTSQLRRGDLIFWGSPGSTTHVAIYLGNGKIVEAAPPRTGTSVHVRSIYGTHTYAVRMFS
jgi:hypothetical protein